MLLYRVIAWRDGAGVEEPGHPLHVDVSRQGGGRADNPSHYEALYVSETPQGAVGEVFGDLAAWSAAMFVVPWLPEGGRALATFEADPPTEVLDLDDPHTLVAMNAKPTDVIGRDRERTRELALSVWMQGAWEGLRWWSWWRPAWRSQVLWRSVSDSPPWRFSLMSVEPLDLDHAAVRITAHVLRRRLE